MRAGVAAGVVDGPLLAGALAVARWRRAPAWARARAHARRAGRHDQEQVAAPVIAATRAGVRRAVATTCRADHGSIVAHVPESRRGASMGPARPRALTHHRALGHTPSTHEPLLLLSKPGMMVLGH